MGHMLRSLKHHISDKIRQKLGLDEKERHQWGKPISYNEVLPGDIFLEYARGGRKYEAIRHGQTILNLAHVRYRNYVHGGIVLDGGKLVHANGGEDLAIEPIADVLGVTEYYIFRPISLDLASTMVNVAKYLTESAVIGYPKFQNKMSSFTKSKTNLALIRKPWNRSMKSFEKLEKEMLSMINKTEYDETMALNSPDIIAYKEQLYKDIEKGDSSYEERIRRAKPSEKRLVKDEIQDEISAIVDAATSIYVQNKLAVMCAGKKQFFCTQFVAWVVQMAAYQLKAAVELFGVGSLQNQNIEVFKPNDILDIRDTKATPARLADILSHSPHFREYHSVERYVHKKDRPTPTV